MEEKDSFKIQFIIPIGKAQTKIQVTATAMMSDCKTHYYVFCYEHADFKIQIKLPLIKIKKEMNEWVHIETQVPTTLSINAGRGIERSDGYKPTPIHLAK